MTANRFFELVPGLTAVGLSFYWLLAQITSRHRTGWISAVILPALLALFTVPLMAPQISGVYSGGGILRLVALALAAYAGFRFDQGSSLGQEEGELRGQRTPWPFLLWGAGAFLFVIAPLGRSNLTLERWAGAVALVSVFAVLGQAAAWAARLYRAQNEGGTAARTGTPPDSRVSGFRAGGLAAGIAIVLLLFRGGGPSAGGGKAPPNSLLVSPAGALSNEPIYILDRGSGSYRKLPAEGTRPRWSPDGTRMAYFRVDPTELWTAAADGSGARRVASVPGVLQHLTWSADGQKLYLAHSEGFLSGDLLVIPAEGGSPEPLLPLSEGVTFPEVSPDGSSLAYFRGADSTQTVQPPRELKVLDLATRQTRSLVSDPTSTWNVTGLAWTRDGQALILCSSDPGGNQFQLERVDVANGQRQPLGASGDYYLSSFTAPPDGSGIVMLAFPRSGGSLDPNRPLEIRLVDPTTGSHQAVRQDGSVKPSSVDASPTR